MSLNRALFTTTDTDSGALNVLGTIVHEFEDVGEYRIDIHRDGRYLTHRYLDVSDEQPRTEVSLDLSTLPEVRGRDPHEKSCCCGDHDVLYLRENGYLVLDVSRGSGGFAVEVTEADDDEPTFDSRELGETDHFAATLMRPGRYVARQLEGDGEATVTVPYPSGSARGVPEPERVAVTDDGFDTDDIEIRTGQGLVFEIDTAARIEIELEEADDGDGSDGDGGGGDGGGDDGDDRSSKGRWTRDPGRTVGEIRFDPVEFGIDAIERKVRKITSKKELQVLKQREKQTKERTAIIDTVERRLEEVADELTGKDDETTEE